MQLITNILLCAILGVLASGIVVAALVFARLKRAFTDFVTPPAEGQPSDLAKAIDAASIMAGRAITAQIKTTLMGQASGQARAEKAIQGDLALDSAENAGLGGLLANFPNLGRTLRRNPSLIDLALPALQSLMSRGSPGSAVSSSSSNGDRPKFKLG